MLKRLGYSAQTAEDGLAAVKAAWVRKFDLILMVNICLHFFWLCVLSTMLKCS